jgi:hypothetical protein
VVVVGLVDVVEVVGLVDVELVEVELGQLHETSRSSSFKQIPVALDSSQLSSLDKQIS